MIVASSARFAGSSGAGADTPWRSRSMARRDAALIGLPSNCFDSSTALLNAARKRSLARALSSCVSTVM